MSTSSRSPLLLAALLAGAGVAHFTRPENFDTIVPRVLPGSARTWTRASGAAEFALAAAVAAPRTRRAGARATALFFAGIFPAHLQMAYDWRDRSTAARAVAYGRMPLQLPLILWARKVARDAG